MGKTTWSRKQQPTLVFLPGKFHGQRSTEGYSTWGHKESGMTEHTTLTHILGDERDRRGLQGAVDPKAGKGKKKRREILSRRGNIM